MLYVKIEEKVDNWLWNDLVRSLPEGNIFQTTYWADYLRATGYCHPFFCSIKDNDEYKAILLFWVEDLNGRICPDNKLISFLGKLSERLRLAYCYWFYGPLILDKVNGDQIKEALFDFLDRFAREKGVIAIKNVGEPIYYHSRQTNNRDNGVYQKFKYRRIEKGTVFIDLSMDRDSLWANLKKSTRKDVNSCQKQDLKIEFLKSDELDAYKKIIYENIKRVKADFPPYYPDEKMWNALRSQENCLEVIVVKKDGKIIGGAGILEFNGIIFHMTSCQSDESYLEKINVNDLLTWEIAKWGISGQKRIYDLTGIPLDPKNKKEKGLRYFKMKWSDNLCIFSAYEKVYRKSLRRLIQIARQIR